MNKSIIFVFLALWMGVFSSPNVVKRSDDQDPMTVVVQQLSAKLASLEAKQASEEFRLAVLEKHAGFKVQFREGAITLQPGTIKFNSIVFNDGNGYDPMTGIFTAPYNGVYAFGFQVFSTGAERFMLDLKLNGHIASRMADKTLGSGSDAQESEITTVTLKLNSGDKVWVENTFVAVSIFGEHHSFFFGSLIYSF